MKILVGVAPLWTVRHVSLCSEMILLTARHKFDFKVLEQREHDCLPTCKANAKTATRFRRVKGKISHSSFVSWRSSYLWITGLLKHSFGDNCGKLWSFTFADKRGGGRESQREEIVWHGVGKRGKREEGSHGLTVLLFLISWVIFNLSVNIECLLYV